eukprot:9491303-Pyramimonas_sp.AAC.1
MPSSSAPVVTLGSCRRPCGCGSCQPKTLFLGFFTLAQDNVFLLRYDRMAQPPPSSNPCKP